MLFLSISFLFPGERRQAGRCQTTEQADEQCAPPIELVGVTEKACDKQGTQCHTETKTNKVVHNVSFYAIDMRQPSGSGRESTDNTAQCRAVLRSWQAKVLVRQRAGLRTKGASGQSLLGDDLDTRRAIVAGNCDHFLLPSQQGGNTVRCDGRVPRYLWQRAAGHCGKAHHRDIACIYDIRLSGILSF
jgi:hypothetical protein